MKTYYCVNVEFYDSGKVLACITSSEKRGKSHSRHFPGMTSFKMWWNSESYAIQILENVRNGSVGFDDFFAVWSDYVDFENEVKARAA